MGFSRSGLGILDCLVNQAPEYGVFEKIEHFSPP